MKKFLITIIILIILSSLVFAKLSDDTLEEVEKLRMKHYHYYKDELFYLEDISDTDYISVTNGDFEYEWQNIWFEDGKLIVSTNKGKWFIEMEKMTE